MIIRLRQKGAIFAEYALALAFVIVVGVVFINSNGPVDSINEIFAKARAMLNGATEDAATQEKQKNYLADVTPLWKKNCCGYNYYESAEYTVGIEMMPIAAGDYVMTIPPDVDEKYGIYAVAFGADHSYVLDFITVRSGDGSTQLKFGGNNGDGSRANITKIDDYSYAIHFEENSDISFKVRKKDSGVSYSKFTEEEASVAGEALKSVNLVKK